METTRYAAGKGARPASLALSGALAALAVAGIVFAGPKITDTIRNTGPILGYPVPVEPDPPPPPPKPLPKAHPNPNPAPRHDPVSVQPEVEVWTPPTGPVLAPGDPVSVDPTPGTGTPGGTGTAIDPPTPPALIEPVADPRYAGDFQPLYPADERRLGHEGLVIVNVLVGTDGRVKQVERISAPSDAFFEVTRRQALSRWRFRPGTRGGEPVERWRRMRVNFVLTDE